MKTYSKRTMLLALICLYAAALWPAKAADLLLYEGISDEESIPATVNFRFELEIFVSALVDGKVEFSASPHVSATESAAGDFALAGEIIRMNDGTTIASISATEPDTKIEADLQAGKLYRIKVASLVNGNPGDKTAKFLLPEGIAAAIPAPLDAPVWLEGTVGFLWIPESCTEILCIGAPRLSLINPEGVRSDLSTVDSAVENAVRVPVKRDQAGQLWKVGAQTRGSVGFAGTTPPWINLNGQNLLLPPGHR